MRRQTRLVATVAAHGRGRQYFMELAVPALTRKVASLVRLYGGHTCSGLAGCSPAKIIIRRWLAYRPWSAEYPLGHQSPGACRSDNTRQATRSAANERAVLAWRTSVARRSAHMIRRSTSCAGKPLLSGPNGSAAAGGASRKPCEAIRSADIPSQSGGQMCHSHAVDGLREAEPLADRTFPVFCRVDHWAPRTQRCFARVRRRLWGLQAGTGNETDMHDQKVLGHLLEGSVSAVLRWIRSTCGRKNPLGIVANWPESRERRFRR